MPQAGWAIRFLEGNNYEPKGTIDFASNYGKDARTLDSVQVFSGIYGIDDYLIWYIHKNIPSYDFSTVVLNLRLTMYKNIEAVYFQDYYRVQDVRYDSNKSQFVLYAISEGSLRLHKKLINFGVTSLSYKENRKAVDIIKDVIEENKIFYVSFHEDGDSTKNLPHYEYRYFDIDIEWTVLDFIQYICNDNLYEWCIDKLIGEDNVPHYILHIGHELKPYFYRNATKPYEPEKDNISTTIYGFKITTEPSPINILSHWEETHKCVWCRHSAGKGGGISKGYFTKIGQGHFNTKLYLNSLEGDIERDIGFSILKREKKRFSSITLGNILKDEGNEYIDEVSIQKNPHTYTVREPHNIIINRGDDLAVKHQLERVTRSTPYLDHNAGLLFPSPKLDDPPPNSLIFNIDGKRESSVVGGYVYGGGREDLVIPYKEKKGDFRLQFPNGWCMYVDEEGNTQFLTRDVDPSTKPDITDTPSQEAIQIITKKDGVPSEIRLFLENGNFIDMVAPLDGVNNITNIFNSGEVWVKGGIKIKLTTGDLIQNYITIGVYGGSNPGIKIIVDGSDPIDITTESGTITVNTTGTVNIGNDATVIRLAGGGSKISHRDHKHLTGNMGIPVPPHTAAEGSDITEVD